MQPAFAIPYYEPGGWIILALMLPGLIVLVGIVLAFIVRRPVKPASAQSYYRVSGLDQHTGSPRESTFQAASADSAAGQAHFAGIVVTEVKRVSDVEGSS